MKKLIVILFLFLLPHGLFAADTKLVDETAISAIANPDLFYCVDDPAGTPLNRKCTAGQIKTFTNDGRDLATDGAKLDGIEAGATADQTGAEIKTAYELEANTNAFTDAEKTKLAATVTGSHTTDTNTQLTQEQVEDFAGALMGTGGTKTRITATYQDASGTFDLIVDDMNDDVPEAGDFGNATDLDANGALNADSVGESELLESMNFAPTGTWNFSTGVLRLPNSITLPGTCAVGDVYFDSDATAGQNQYGCTALNTWTLQGDGGGGGGDSITVDTAAVVDPDFASTGDIDFIDTTNTITANINPGVIIEPDLNADVAPVDLDYLQYDSVGTNFTWRSPAEVLSDIGAQGLLTNEAGLYAALSDVSLFLEDLLDDTTPQLGGQLDINANCLGDGTLELLCFSETGSAVNEITVKNAGTGAAPQVQATGTDTNIDLQLTGKGTGVVRGHQESKCVTFGDETTAITTGTAKFTFYLPYAINLVGVYGYLTTASSSGLPTFDLNEAGVTVLSTKVTLDITEKTSSTAATPPVISDATIAAHAELTVDIDVAGTGAAGPKLCLVYYQT